MRQRIEAHPWPRGGVEVVRANRGYTLYHYLGSNENSATISDGCGLRAE